MGNVCWSHEEDEEEEGGKGGREDEKGDLRLDFVFLAGREKDLGRQWRKGSVSFSCGLIQEFDMYMNL